MIKELRIPYLRRDQIPLCDDSGRGVASRGVVNALADNSLLAINGEVTEIDQMAQGFYRF